MPSATLDRVRPATLHGRLGQGLRRPDPARPPPGDEPRQLGYEQPGARGDEQHQRAGPQAGPGGDELLAGQAAQRERRQPHPGQVGDQGAEDPEHGQLDDHHAPEPAGRGPDGPQQRELASALQHRQGHCAGHDEHGDDDHDDAYIGGQPRQVLPVGRCGQVGGRPRGGPRHHREVTPGGRRAGQQRTDARGQRGRGRPAARDDPDEIGAARMAVFGAVLRCGPEHRRILGRIPAGAGHSDNGERPLARAGQADPVARSQPRRPGHACAHDDLARPGRRVAGVQRERGERGARPVIPGQPGLAARHDVAAGQFERHRHRYLRDHPRHAGSAASRAARPAGTRR